MVAHKPTAEDTNNPAAKAQPNAAMAPVDMVLTIISAIKTVIELYEDLESGKKEVDDTERSLGSYYVVFKSTHATFRLKGRSDELGDVGKQLGKHTVRIEEHCDALKELLLSVRNRTSPDPTKFRHRYLKLHELNWTVWNWGPAGRAWVQAEVAEIQRKQTAIDNLLHAIGFSRSEAAAIDQKKIIDTIERSGAGSTRTGWLPLAAPTAGRGLPAATATRGRSVISQGIMELLAHWTRARGKPFPVAEWGSAGFFVRAQGDCVGEIRSMRYLTKKFVFEFKDGGEPTEKVARDALYDNKALGRIPPDPK